MKLNAVHPVDVDVVVEANDAHKYIRYNGITYVVTDITAKNQHGDKHLIIEALELNEYKRDLEQAARSSGENDIDELSA